MPGHPFPVNSAGGSDLGGREPATVTIDNSLDSLSDDRRKAAQTALAATFGTTPIDALAPIGGGASSAMIFRVTVRGRGYLLRLEGEPSPLRNPQQYAAMRIAADAGIAPAIHFIDETSRVAIMDLVEQQPVQDYPGGPRRLAQALGALLARLQDVPAFPTFVDYPDIVSRLFAHVRRTGLFAPGLLDPHVERLEEIRHAYSAGTTRLVASHNDCNPRNVLYDGRRLWLIDWESAYLNDPLVDAAIAVDSFGFPPGLDDVLVQACLGRRLDTGTLARLTVVRALTRLYFAGVFLSASAVAWKADPDGDLSVPTLAQFRQAVHDGSLAPGAPRTRHVLGKMYLESFMTGTTPPDFGVAI